jgi:hypothetical protein
MAGLLRCYRCAAKLTVHYTGSLHDVARYAASRAERQFDASDPENRLVTAELERRWNQALDRVREIEQRIAQHSGQQPDRPAPTIAEFSALAERLEELWQCADTDVRLRKRIVRSLIHEVIVDGGGDRTALIRRRPHSTRCVPSRGSAPTL